MTMDAIRAARGAAVRTRGLPAAGADPADRLGICQWFHYGDRDTVLRSVDLMHELGLRRIRTAVSWADDYRPDGPAWHDWVMGQLEGFEVLLCVWHTPPSIAENGACNGPPRRLGEYGEFLEFLISRYPRVREYELWNEPNNRLKWDFIVSDPGWAKFAAMIGDAAARVRAHGRTTVLGGMIPVDPAWLELVGGPGALEEIDVVAIHGFPGMWWPDFPNWDWHRDWLGWEEKVAKTAAVAGGRPVWVTETGLATVDLATRRPARQEMQCEMLAAAAACPSRRVYWYSLIDLDPSRDAIEGFHVDENEYHLGLVTHGGQRKPAFEVMAGLLRGDATAAGDRRRPFGGEAE